MNKAAAKIIPVISALYNVLNYLMYGHTLSDKLGTDSVIRFFRFTTISTSKTLFYWQAVHLTGSLG